MSSTVRPAKFHVTGYAGPNGPHYISVATVGLASALVLTNACLSFCLSLGIGMSLIVAAVRHARLESPVHCGSQM